jgi:prepilin-type processing-associated H-X9-DG protein
MPISFTCPHCGATKNVADEYMGQTGPCSSCGKQITIPVVKAKGSGGSGLVILVAVLLIGGVMTLACGGVLVALLLPAVQAAREAARRTQCSNNLKQIGLAMHNYHDVYKSFPPAYLVDEEGNPTHSWRTLILPFIEQNALYSQIRLDEPWDSPHNRQFASFVIPAFNCPSAGEASNNTNYMVIVAEDTIFRGDSPVQMAEITDGTSNTILVVEVYGATTSWMEPVDLELEDMQMAINGGNTEIRSRHPGGANVAFADGSVHFLAESIDPAMLRNLITRDDGQAISY